MREEIEVVKERLEVLEKSNAEMRAQLDAFFANVTGESVVVGEPDEADRVE